jgi:putative ABC transport system permease protein
MDGTLLLVSVVIIVFSIVGVLAIRNRTLMRIAARNLGRRKTNTIIVISGLLIGTAIITSSFVAGDTMGYIFENVVYEQLGAIDEYVHKPPGNETGGEAGLYPYFNYSVYENLTVARNQGQLPSIDGLSPVLGEPVPVYNPATELSEPYVGIFGIDPRTSEEFGDFHDTSGARIDAEAALSAPGDVIINERLADGIDAEEGHLITVLYVIVRPNASDPSNPILDYKWKILHVVSIAKNEGLANLENGEIIFIHIDQAQEMFEKEGRINLVVVSNVGDVEGGVERSDSAVSEIEAVLANNPYVTLEVEAVKKDNIEMTKEASEAISEVFSIMGTFSIVAGVILVINIFVMLAEERKPEMGVSRALGMKKRHLVQTYLFEGSAYALIASFVGTFVGLAIAYIMVTAFGSVFGALGFEIPFHFEVESLVLGFCIGVIVTFLTVALASWVVSRLNIVRAIRAIPEPSIAKPTGIFMVGAILLVVFGILFFFIGYVQLSGAYFMTGPCLFLLGGGMLASRWVSPRISYSVSSAAILFWVLAPIEWMEDIESGLEMFVLSGLFLVLAAILLLMVNSSALLKILTKIVGTRKGTLPVMRVALSYPMKKKFRTGMTLAMFSLIIFTVMVIAMISSFQANSVEEFYVTEAGGYDIIAFSNPNAPIGNISGNISANPDLANKFEEISSFSMSFTSVYAKEEGEDSSVNLYVYGADESFRENNDFTFHSIMEGYDSPREVWDAVGTDPTLVVLDGSAAIVEMQYGLALLSTLQVRVGDTLVVQTQDKTEEKLVVGILDESMFFQGVITSDAGANDLFGPRVPAMFFFTASDPGMTSIRELSKDLEREYLGIETIIIKDVITEFLKISSSIMGLFQVYLGLGLIVGIAGLGIITIRSVVERTNEIGVMRAIGYKKNMVSKAFIMEIAFISIMGITVGVVLGVALSYYIYGDFFGETPTLSEFVALIPFVNILLITIIALFFTLLATASSALRASRIIPAEALRFKE